MLRNKDILELKRRFKKRSLHYHQNVWLLCRCKQKQGRRIK